MIDSNATLIAWLLQSAVIVDLVGDRISYPMLPEGYEPARDGVALVIKNRGGSADTELPIIRPSAQITAWAPENEGLKARELYRAVWDHIHGKTNINLGAAGYVLSCLEEVQGQDVTDPDTGWAAVISCFRLTMRAS